MTKKKVVFMGKGDLAIRIAEWFLNSDSYEISLIVPVIPEPVWTGSLVKWAEKAGIPYVADGRFKSIPGVQEEEWRTDLAFSVFYDRIIRQWFIDKCDRILNLHNGPLPKYRGVAPINWALKNEEKEHGVTIHEITAGIDDGPIVSQLKYSVYPEFDEVRDVYMRSLDYGWELFRQTMPMLDKIVARPQDNSIATYYTKEDGIRLGDRKNFTRAQS